MADFPEKAKLKIIGQYTQSALRVKSTPFYIAFVVYSWANDLLAALASIGLSAPFLSDQQKIPTSGAVSVGAGAAIAWVILKTAVTREDGIKRGTLMRSCAFEMLKLRSVVLREAVQAQEMMPILLEVQKQLSAVYDRQNQEQAWPWPGGFAPNIDVDVEKDVTDWLAAWPGSKDLTPKLDAVVANLQRE